VQISKNLFFVLVSKFAISTVRNDDHHRQEFIAIFSTVASLVNQFLFGLFYKVTLFETCQRPVLKQRYQVVIDVMDSLIMLVYDRIIIDDVLTNFLWRRRACKVSGWARIINTHSVK